MKVLFQRHGLINENYKSFFRSELPDTIELIFSDGPDKLHELAQKVEIFVGYSVTKEFLECASNLRHIQIPWTGFNSLNIELMKDYPNITVSNSHSNSLSIAEHAVSLLLSAAKLIVQRDSGMRNGDWTTRYSDTNSFWLTGKTLGIIGYGAIGKKVARMLKHGFNMKVLATKRGKGKIDDNCDFLGDINDLDYVLQESDFLLVSTPLTKETIGLIGHKQFLLMKPNAIIVNIARGPVIDEQSLYENLLNNRIGGAGVDVWYNYPKGQEVPQKEVVMQNYPFEKLPNIVMSPHSAFKVRDREEVFSEDIVENINRIYDGQDPINIVNLDLGY